MQNDDPSSTSIHSAWYRTACASCLLARGLIAVPEHALRMARKGSRVGIKVTAAIGDAAGILPIVFAPEGIGLVILIGPAIIGAGVGAAAGLVTGATAHVMAIPEVIYQLRRPDAPQSRGLLHRYLFG